MINNETDLQSKLVAADAAREALRVERDEAVNRALAASKRYAALIHESGKLEAEVARLRAALEIAEDVLDNYSDVTDGDDGRPRANSAMSALAEVRAALSGEEPGR